MRDAHRAAFVANADALVLPDPAKFAALAPGKQWRWPTSQPTTWELRHMRSGQPLPPLSPVRHTHHASWNETGSEKEFPRRFQSWSLITSNVEARSAETSSAKLTFAIRRLTPTRQTTAASASRSLAGRLATHEHVAVDAAAGWQCASVVCRAAQSQACSASSPGSRWRSSPPNRHPGSVASRHSFGVPSFSPSNPARYAW